MVRGQSGWFPGIFFMSILVLGCSERQPTEETQWEPVAAEQPKSEVQTSGPKIEIMKEGPPSFEAGPPPEDRSLETLQYVVGGMERPDRPWSGTEMKKAAKVLSVLVEEDQAHLPRFQSDKSGLIFQRLTADENLDIFRNPSYPLEKRLANALVYLKSLNQIMEHYLTAFNDKVTGDSELVRLSGSLLRFYVVLVALIDDFVETLDPQDPSYANRMKGLDTMIQGLTKILWGNVVKLTQRQAYRVSELKRMLEFMGETLPTLLSKIDANERIKIINQMRSFQGDPRMQDLKAELARVNAELAKMDGGASGSKVP